MCCSSQLKANDNNSHAWYSTVREAEQQMPGEMVFVQGLFVVAAVDKYACTDLGT